MDITTRPPLLDSPDARPLFGVDTIDGFQEVDGKDIAQQFSRLAMGMLDSTGEKGSMHIHRLKKGSEVSSGLINPLYEGGYIGVAAMRLKEPFGNLQISITYFLEGEDNSGRGYPEWGLQMNYHLDESGTLVREDRTPPTEADGEMFIEDIKERDVEHCRRISEISALFAQHQNELNEAASKESVATMRDKFALDLARLGMMHEQHSSAREAARATSIREGRQMLIDMGMNEQPVSKGEFDYLVTLIRDLYPSL